MGRYRKYLTIIDQLDDALEKQGKKLTEGKVSPDQVTLLYQILATMEKAWCMSRIIDMIDDTLKANQPGGQSEDIEARGGMATGRDFRGGHPYPEAGAIGGSSAGLWTPSRRSHGSEEARMMSRMMDQWEAEQDRRGRSRRTGRYVHRSGMDGMDMEDMTSFMPWMFPFMGRMGYEADPMEGNRMYNGVLPSGLPLSGDIKVPVQGTESGTTSAVSKPAPAGAKPAASTAQGA